MYDICRIASGLSKFDEKYGDLPSHMFIPPKEYEQLKKVEGISYINELVLFGMRVFPCKFHTDKITFKNYVSDKIMRIDLLDKITNWQEELENGK